MEIGHRLRRSQNPPALGEINAGDDERTADSPGGIRNPGGSKPSGVHRATPSGDGDELNGEVTKGKQEVKGILARK